MTLTKTPAKRPTATHKKRHGQHHKHDTHHYVKHYWPYLPLLLVVGLGLVLNVFFGQANRDVLGYATNISGKVLLDETNAERAKDNESSLALSSVLSQAAQDKANDMAKRGYWDHVTPDGKQPWAFIDAVNYKYESAGENLAYGFGTSDQVVTAWMHSPEHRDNILNAAYSEVGFATANVANYRGEGPATIVVALYAKPVGVTVTAMVRGPEVLPASVNVATEPQKVSRFDTIVANRGLQLTLAAFLGAAMVLLFIRHGRAWHRVLVRGERFVLHHPIADIFLVAAVVMAFILIPIAGNIL